eukprot:g17479.t1
MLSNHAWRNPCFIHVAQPAQAFASRLRPRLQIRAFSLETALQLSEGQRWSEAVTAWEALLDGAELPEQLRAPAGCALGDALLKLGRDAAAARRYAAAVAAAGGAAAALRLGGALRRLGRFSAAERAYRRVLRRPRGTRQDVSEGVLGAAVMMLRQGKISKQRRLLEVWIAMSPQDPKAAHHLLLLAMALWLRPSNGSRKRVEQLLGRAARVANPTLQPLLAELLGEDGGDETGADTAGEREKRVKWPKKRWRFLRCMRRMSCWRWLRPIGFWTRPSGSCWKTSAVCMACCRPRTLNACASTGLRATCGRSTTRFPQLPVVKGGVRT